MKNMELPLFGRHFFPIFLRDYEIVTYILLFEHTSLPALFFLARNFRSIHRKRKLIMKGKRVNWRHVEKWFRTQFVPL